MSSNELDTPELDVTPMPCRPRKLVWSPNDENDEPNDENDEPIGGDSDEPMEPSGSVKKGGNGKLSLMDGKGGVESVGCTGVEMPAGGLEIAGVAGLEIVVLGGLEIAGFGGLERVGFPGLESVGVPGIESTGFGGLEIEGFGGLEIVGSGGLEIVGSGGMSSGMSD